MINIDALNDDEKLAALESIHKSIAESKEIQKKKITTNVEMILKALKKIEGDLKQRYDETGSLIANLKNGTDGRDGKEGRDGKDGRAGKDGAMGPRGYDGLPGRNGLDGEDGVSITDAHIDFDGSLIISLSTGRVINVGEVVTADIAERIKVITNGGGTSQYVLDTLASLQSQISAISSGLEYQGTWNASTNVPTLASSVGTAGYYYIVGVAGSTNLNGITDWQVGDWAVFNGTVWQKIDQTNLVTSVAGRTGAIVLTTADIGGLGTIATQASSNVSITGGSITGITDLAIADGGTGQSTAAAAITALTGTQTSGYYLRSNGTNSVLAAIVAADVPTLNQNTTGSAGSLSNTLPVSQGGTNLTSLTNKGVLYASSTSQVATGTALQFDGTNLGVGTTQSTWGATFKAIEIGEQGSIAYESNGSTKKTYLSTNAYNATAIGARPYYKVNGLASEYTQNVGEHAWYTAPTGIAGSSTTITSGQIYTNLTAGNQPDFGAVNGLVGTIWTATSSGTLTSGTVVQNISFIESMRIDASSNVGIGISNPGSRLDVKGTLRLSGSTSGYVGLAPAAAAGSTTYTLPSADGTANQALVTNGSGTLSWASTTTGTVTSVAASVPTFLSITGSPITTSGTLAISLSGTALPTTSGGTNLTSFTSGGVVYASSTSALATGSALTFDGTTLTNSGGTNTINKASGLSTLNLATAGTTNANFVWDNNNGYAYIGTTAVASLAFNTGGSEGMRLTSTGLGIGTSSPNAKLNVVKSADNSRIAIGDNVATGTYSTLLMYGGLGKYNFQLGVQNNVNNAFEITPSTAVNGTTFSTPAFVLDSSGNVGIGTSSPAFKLQVTGANSSSGGINITGTGTNGLRLFQDATTGDSYINNFQNGFMAFSNNNSEKMRLDTSGNLGLGVTPSASNLPTFESTYGLIVGVSEVNILQNAFYSSGFKYKSSSLAAHYQQNAGVHAWFNAPSGTAGNAITFTQAMTLDASGNLAIGTSSFAGSAKLQVAGGRAYFGSNDTVYSINLSYNNTRALVGQGYYLGATDSATPSLVFSNTDGTARATLDYAGNLGLGVTPSAWDAAVYKALQISTNSSIASFTNGETRYSSNCFYNTSTWKYITSSQLASAYTQGAGAHTWFNAPSGTAGNAITFTQAMTLDASGNLLVGTTGGDGRLVVDSGSSSAMASFNSTNATGGYIPFSTSGTIYGDIGTAAQVVSGGSASDFAINARGVRNLVFGSNNTERARIDSSGNLLVGTTSAYASGATPHLFVSANTSGSYVGVFKNANATPGCLILDLSADPNNTSDTYIATGQNRFKVLSNGNVQNTNNSYGAISDVKLKENIVDASPKLADLMQVKVRNYNLIGETTRQIGVVAQELETVFPAMVDESLDRDAEGNDLGTTTKSVKYSVFVPMLIKAMQEQQAIIESLKARLDAANL